jgi:hypothetical protein
VAQYLYVVQRARIHKTECFDVYDAKEIQRNRKFEYKLVESVQIQFIFNIIFNIPDIVHRPVFYMKHNVSGTGFCLLILLGPIQVGPIHKASSVDWIQLGMYRLKTDRI